MSAIPFFDGHNDSFTKHDKASPEGIQSFLSGNPELAIDLEGARAANMLGGLYAIFSWDPDDNLEARAIENDDGSYRVPISKPYDPQASYEYTKRIAAEMHEIIEASDGKMQLVTAAGQLEQNKQSGIQSIIFHIEGAEAIRTLDDLDEFYELGLRSLGPVWSRPNKYGHGVPFDFPRGPDTGEGLSAEGIELVKKCDQMGILLDTSHINLNGFWGILKNTNSVVVASHSNAYALCRSTRNLRDDQIDAIRERNGVIGVNFAIRFFRSDGQEIVDTELDQLAAHVDYLVEKAGIDHVCLGSDYDGATVPAKLRRVEGVQELFKVLSERGYKRNDLEKIAYRNWFRVLADSWE